MAGSDVTVVVDQKAVYPVGLCVDTKGQRIYWYDGEYYGIFTSKYDGNDVILYHTSYDIFVLNLAVYMVSSHFKL